MRETEKHRIVANGRRQILTDPHYQATSRELRHKLMRRCAPLLATSSRMGKVIIRIRIRRYCRRRLNKMMAPPWALYLVHTNARVGVLHLRRRGSSKTVRSCAC